MMKIGKVSETVLNRSVLKGIDNKDNIVGCGPVTGCDGALLNLEGGQVVTATNPVTINCGVEAYIGISRVVNDVAAMGGVPAAITAVILIPPKYKESLLKELMHRINKACELAGVVLAGGHTEVTPAVNSPCVTFTCIGKGSNFVPCIKAGQDVIMAGVAALEGAFVITNHKKEDILKKYSPSFYDKCCIEKKELFIHEVALEAIKGGAAYVHNLSTGGILNGLWELASFGNVGLDIDFKKILLKQEIIEICELFELNLYQLASGGSLLMTIDPHYDIVEILKSKGIMACKIGVTTDSNDRILRNESEVRYLDSPKADELLKIFY